MVGEPEQEKYRRLVGKLMYVIAERPHLAYPVKQLARKVSGPDRLDMERLKRVARYLAGRLDYALKLQWDFSAEEGEIKVVVDADWATSPDRRSTSGGYLQFQGVLLTYWSRTQPTISTSTCEAELVSMFTGVQEAALLQSLMKELALVTSMRAWSDSTSALAFTEKRGVGRMKHLDIKFLMLQDMVRQNALSTGYLETTSNPADMFTKGLNAKVLEKHCGTLGFSRLE